MLKYSDKNNDMANDTLHKSMLTITGWNMRCMNDNVLPYIHHLAETSDIIALSEHGLFPAELYKMNDFHCEMTSMAKSSRQLTD